MNDINRVIITGRLTKDPELKTTASGQSYCRFSIANNYSVKQNNEWVKKANFFDFVAWGRLAEVVKNHCTKGQKLTIDGALRWSSWEHEGKKHSKVEIIAERLEFMDSKTNGPEQSQPQGDPAAAAIFDGIDNDIPF